MENLTAERPKLSAFVVAYNRQDIIGTALKALGFVDELILIDKSSTDATARIGAPLVDRLVIVPWSPTVEDTRAYACSLCTHDWILFLDDDECLTPEAALFIDQELRAPRADIYRLPQRHHILAVHDEGAYYWLERQTRLFRKGTLEFSPTVHGGFVNLSEKVYDVPAESGVAMMHLSHANVAQWIEKTNRYTSQSDRVRMPDEGRDLVAFAHRSIEKWTARRLVDRPGSYPEAVGLLRSIYDLIDRLKTWEEERGLEGEARFAEICLALETRYASELGNIQRERSPGVKDIEVKQADVPTEAPSAATTALLLRTNASLTDILKATRLAGEDLRHAFENACTGQATLANELSQARIAAEEARVELSQARIAAEKAREETESLRGALEKERANAERESVARKALAKEAESLRSELEWQLRNAEREKISRINAEAALDPLLKKAGEMAQIRKSLLWGPLRTSMKLEKTLRSLLRRRAHKPEKAELFSAATAVALDVQQPSENVAIPPQPVILRTCPIGLDDPEMTKAQGGDTSLLICISHVSPWPSRAGNDYRVQRMLMWLRSQGWDVVLILCPLPGEEKSEQEVVALASQCPNLIYVNRSGLLQYHSNRADVVACIQSLDGRKTQDFFAALGEGNENHPVSRLNSLMHTFSPDALVETLIALEKALLPRVILANYIFMTRGLPLLRTGALTIVDTIDVFSTKAAKVSAFGIEDALAMSRQEEGALLARADVALAIQAEEAEELRQIAPKTKVLTVGVDMPKMSRNHGAKDKKIILLVASENPMNVKGLRDFLRFSWRRVLEAHPDAKLHVVGSVGNVLSGEEPNVTRLGRVDDLASVYDQARLVINPAVAGTGLKIKTLEALAHLLPIVVWPSGVDGVPVELRSLCECVTDWFAFTQSVIRLLDDDEASARMNGARDRISELLSPKTVYAELGELLQEHTVLVH